MGLVNQSTKTIHGVHIVRQVRIDLILNSGETSRMGRYNQSASDAFFVIAMRIRSLVIVVEALLSIALATGYPCRTFAAGDSFNATFEAMGGAQICEVSGMRTFVRAIICVGSTTSF
jgi:hypothetical protein